MPPKKKVASSSSSSSSSSEDNKPLRVAIDPVVESFGPPFPQDGARFGPLVMDATGKKEDGQGTDVEVVAEDSVSQASVKGKEKDKGTEKGREQGRKGQAGGKDKGKGKGKGKDNDKDNDKGSMGTTRDYPLGRNRDMDNAYWDGFIDTSVTNITDAVKSFMYKAFDKGHDKGNDKGMDKGFGKGEDTAWDRAYIAGYQARKLEETMAHGKGPYDKGDWGP